MEQWKDTAFVWDQLLHNITHHVEVIEWTNHATVILLVLILWRVW